MKKITSILTIIFVLLLSFWWLFPQVFSCLLIPYEGFTEISPQVFVNNSTSPKRRAYLLKSREIAHRRIQQFWGNYHGKATLVYCDSPTIYSKICRTSEGSGCSVGTPFGSWIILNTDGLNPDVIAHEMCHDELMTRVGWLKTMQEIPTWFDEGLALQLDDRFVSSHDSLQRYIGYRAELALFPKQRMPLSLLRTNKQFFSADNYSTKFAYLTAATEVSHILALSGRNKLFQLLNELKAGKKFEDLYFKK